MVFLGICLMRKIFFVILIFNIELYDDIDVEIWL